MTEEFWLYPDLPIKGIYTIHCSVEQLDKMAAFIDRWYDDDIIEKGQYRNSMASFAKEMHARLNVKAKVLGNEYMSHYDYETYAGSKDAQFLIYTEGEVTGQTIVHKFCNYFGANCSYRYKVSDCKHNKPSIFSRLLNGKIMKSGQS